MTERKFKKSEVRPPGTGCLKCRGRDSKGRDVWACRIALGRDADGKRISMNKTLHGTRTVAQRWISEQLAKKDTGAAIFKTKVQLSEYLLKWLKEIARPRVSERTFVSYEWLLNHHIIRQPIGRLQLVQLRSPHVQEVYGKLSASTARHVHGPLRSALQQAVKWQLIHSNPCDGVELPRHRAREMRALTKEEAARFVAVERFTRKENGRSAVLVENKHRALFNFLLEIGARPSEALALKWQDIDMENATATIQRTLQWHEGKGKGHYFSEPKTKRSRRSVPLSANLMRQLQEHRAKQGEQLLKLGVRTDLVFSNTEGMPIMRKNLVRRHYKPALKAAGLPVDLSLYCLRHTCASLQLQAGVHPKVVSERLGHSSTTLTMDVYSHVMPGMQSEATAQLEKLLYG
ncbi:MAG: site-specific integrase [Pyrinomonadaceae bacterium]|nr:site-specific integrase [Pyrinomonadaceae bacterium]